MLGKRASLESNNNADFVFLPGVDDSEDSTQISKAPRTDLTTDQTDPDDHTYVPKEGLVVVCSQLEPRRDASIYEQATQAMSYEDDYSQMSQADHYDTFSQFRNHIYKEHDFAQAKTVIQNTPEETAGNAYYHTPLAPERGTINDAIANSVRAARERADLLQATSAQRRVLAPAVAPAIEAQSVASVVAPAPIYEQHVGTQSQEDITFSQFCHQAYESAAHVDSDVRPRTTAYIPAVQLDAVGTSHIPPARAVSATVPAPPPRVPNITNTALPTTSTSSTVPTPAASSPLKAIMYFDGGALGNPGVGGAGYLLYPDYLRPPHIFPAEPIAKAAVRMHGTNCTNNQAEYTGLIHGLQAALARGVRVLDVYGDSQLVIKQMKREYKVKNHVLIGMNRKAQHLAKDFASISYNWVDRNKNKPADWLSARAMHQPWTAEETADHIQCAALYY